MSVERGRALVVPVPDPDALAVRLARRLASDLRAAVRDRGRAVAGLSGGSTPWPGYRALADHAVPWPSVDRVQVDERVAPDGDPARNATGLAEHLPAAARARLHPMPVTPPDPAGYAQVLTGLAGRPPVLDTVVLGIGTDGHTASLVPGDPVLDVTGEAVALTRPYQGRTRMTLTFPVLQRARRLIVVAAGAAKRDAVTRMLVGDPSIPAGRLPLRRMTAILDAAALG